MASTSDTTRQRRLDLVEEVDDLNQEVKTLALNLAIHMAKVRAGGNSKELATLEPQFIRLVNGAVKAVQELAIVLGAARNEETMVYDVPTSRHRQDQVEFGLRSILEQCSQIMGSLTKTQDLTA